MAGDDLLRRAPHPSHAEIEEGLAGNYCRCGCYYQIFEAVEAAAAGRAQPRGCCRPSPDLPPQWSTSEDGPTGADCTSMGEPMRPVGRSPTSDARSAQTAHRRAVGGRGARHRRAALRRRHAPAQRAARQAGDRCRLLTPEFGRSTLRAALAVPGVRLVFTAGDLPQPMPRFGPQFTRSAGDRDRRDEVSRRSGRRGGGGNARRCRGSRTHSSRSTTRSCRPSSRSPARSPPTRRSCRTPRSTAQRPAGQHQRPARAQDRLGRG